MLEGTNYEKEGIEQRRSVLFSYQFLNFKIASRFQVGYHIKNFISRYRN